MRKNKPKSSVISTGTVSIVLIFVLLSMLTFSVLSYVSAQANLRLSRKSADRTTAYYAAENAANEILIQIEETARRLLTDAGTKVPSADELAAAVCAGLDSACGVTAQGEQLSYQVTLGQQQVLQVALTMLPAPEAGGLHYRIDAWQAVSDYDWDGDSMPELLDLDDLP